MPFFTCRCLRVSIAYLPVCRPPSFFPPLFHILPPSLPSSLWPSFLLPSLPWGLEMSGICLPNWVHPSSQYSHQEKYSAKLNQGRNKLQVSLTLWCLNLWSFTYSGGSVYKVLPSRKILVKKKLFNNPSIQKSILCIKNSQVKFVFLFHARSTIEENIYDSFFN